MPWSTASTRSALSGLATDQAVYLTESGREGVFTFDSSNRSAQVSADTAQGIYIAPASNPTGAVGAWVRKFTGRLIPTWFGAAGDGTTLDAPIILAMIATDKALAINNDGGLYKGGVGFWIDRDYLMGTTTIDVTHTTAFDGPGSVNGYRGRFIWTGDCDGIRVQATNTSGTSTVDGPHFSGAYTRIKGIGLIGPYSNNPDFTGRTEGDFHAVRARANVVLEDYFIDGWAGDGIHSDASVGGGGALEGNSNMSFVGRGKITNCRDLISLNGTDANVWSVAGPVVGVYARRWTINESSQIGNRYGVIHSANAGLVKGVPATVVAYNGNRYAVKVGQAAGASTKAPSGTTADNQWWLYLAAGAPDANLNVPAWTSGVSVRAGGTAYFDNATAYNLAEFVYQEGGEGPVQFQRPTLIVGGIWGSRAPYDYGGGTANQLQGYSFSFMSGGALGQTRVSASDNIRQLGIHNSGPNGAALMSTLTFEQGYEADLATPMAVARIRAFPNTNNPATAEGVICWGTRTFGGGGSYTDWLELNGPNLRLSPLIDNRLDLGIPAARWKAGYFYTVNAAASVTSAGPITSTGGGVGYATGAGGTVIQTTSKATPVSINKLCGQIATSNAALVASTSVEFTVNNNQVAATDNVVVTLTSGGAGVSSYIYWVSAVAAGSFKITVYNRAGVSKSETLVFNFAVLKAVSA